MTPGPYPAGREEVDELLLVKQLVILRYRWQL